ncbi:hypothetical protein JX265_006515 [Neoarthrinium moseri]|uniref:EthD domain-containing protein n=1 Tax=Neoarthrinium moseri TaxID=1658444 RepID=A0A9P9WLQ7_9PEZI|nr:hypothetical protein JX266_000207 [Neoarthrinium moseri]KAI1869425.1 hypothetical protein JX265_006515 [Neoarthrinium moseri]
MPVEVVVIAYPKGAEMNVDYYINKHVPMVYDLWQPYAKTWRAEIPSSTSDSPYELILFAEMENEGDFGKVLAAQSEETTNKIRSDGINYTKMPPVIWTQLRVGEGPSA